MLDPVLHSFLRCPHHPDSELLLDEQGTSIELRCRECGRLYPVREGIPNMLDPRSAEAGHLEKEAQQWDTQASGYDVRREDPQYMAGASAVARALAAKPGEWILDSGCGTGLTLGAFFKPGMRVIALDLSVQSLLQLRHANPDPGIMLVQGDISQLPFKNGAFQRVLCANAIQHLPQAEIRERCIRELARVAAPA
ncbi:MAG: methyltransferase domain-containing protein, partial [Planctomycetes bacterium]|nr:methyltransferase domain-containing protein [Planctomycetota bacterium]